MVASDNYKYTYAIITYTQVTEYTVWCQKFIIWRWSLHQWLVGDAEFL